MKSSIKDPKLSIFIGIARAFALYHDREDFIGELKKVIDNCVVEGDKITYNDGSRIFIGEVVDGELKITVARIEQTAWF